MKTTNHTTGTSTKTRPYKVVLNSDGTEYKIFKYAKSEGDAKKKVIESLSELSEFSNYTIVKVIKLRS